MGRERTPVPTVMAPKSPEIANLIKDFVALHRGSAAAWCERGSARGGERAAGVVDHGGDPPCREGSPRCPPSQLPSY